MLAVLLYSRRSEQKCWSGIECLASKTDGAKGSHHERKVQFFLTLFKQGGGGLNPCSKIML